MCDRAGSGVPGSTGRPLLSFSRSGSIDESLARIWLAPNARRVCELSHSSYFRDVCLCRSAANSGPDVSGRQQQRLPQIQLSDDSKFKTDSEVEKKESLLNLSRWRETKHSHPRTCNDRAPRTRRLTARHSSRESRISSPADVERNHRNGILSFRFVSCGPRRAFRCRTIRRRRNSAALVEVIAMKNDGYE
jgi:hypothetical protein